MMIYIHIYICIHVFLYTFWVRPQEVTHGPVMGHLLFSVNGSDLVQCLNGGRQATVHTEDLWGKSEIDFVILGVNQVFLYFFSIIK